MRTPLATLGLLVLLSPACGTPTTECTLARAERTVGELSLELGGACAGRVDVTVRVATGNPALPTWQDAPAGDVVVAGDWRVEGASAQRTVVLRNTGAMPVTIAGIEWTFSGATRPGPSVLLHNGYQSWSYTGIEKIPASIDSVRGTVRHGGDNEDLTGEVAGVSWWWTFASDPTGRGVMVGATGGTVFKTYIGVQRDVTRLVQGVTGDAITLGAGEERTLDGLYFAAGDVRQRLEDYAAVVAGLHPRATAHPPLGGWGSWNVYYEHPDAAAMRDEAAFAAEALLPRGLPDLLLDDGYEERWGQWTASARFGASLEELAREQTAAGLRPAIWLAPTYISTDDPVVALHPEWFVRHGDGTLRTYNNFGPTYATLDASHPEARAFVAGAVRQLRDWGFRTLKIDFLFGGALESVEAGKPTALESYQLWMQTIREAVPEVHLVGCGAPMLPSVGWVDSMRVGTDIAFTTAPDPRYPFIAGAARNTAFRAFTDAWWALDPDVVLLRGDRIDDAAAFTTIVASAMAGGNYLLGDAQQAPGARLARAIDPEILALARDGVAARPVDIAAQLDERLFISPLIDVSGETQVPHQWLKSVGGKHWLAAFAWADDPATVAVDLPPSAREIVPTATGTERRPFAGGRTVEVEKHGVRLFTW